MKKSVLLPLFFAILLCSCNSSKTKPSYDLAINHITVINLDDGTLSEDQSVFISEGSIQAISATTDDGDTATETIDGSGKYLLPGFWDNHVHFRGGDFLLAANKNFLNLFMANGVTTVRECGGDMTFAIHDWQKQIAAGTLAGPTIYTSGPKLDGPDAHWAGSLPIAQEADIAPALDSLQALDVDFVKLYDSTFDGDLYLKTIAAAQKRGMISSGHMPFSVTLEETTAAGIDAIEHLYYILKGCSADEAAITEDVKSGKSSFWASLARVMDTYADTTAQHTFSTLIDRNVFVVPTLHIGHTLSYLDENDHSTDPYLAYMGAGIEKTYEGRIKSALNANESFVKMRKHLDSTFVTLAKNLEDAGVTLLAGSDCGAFNSYIYPGQSLHQELQAMVDAGLTPLQALQTSGPHGSLFLKKEKTAAIKPGYVADLVVLNANPLEDISQTSNIARVIKNGKSFEAGALKNMLQKPSE